MTRSHTDESSDATPAAPVSASVRTVTRRHSLEYASHVRHVARWLVLIVPVAVLIGSAVALFLWSLDLVTAQRWATPWLVWLLPLGGVAIGLLYHAVGRSAEAGNNLIVDEIHEPGAGVPARMAPLVLIGTLGTHLVGGSAGREGTAVQMGGSIASTVARTVYARVAGTLAWFRLDPNDQRMLLQSGVAAGFGAVFGTPIAGAIFALEVLAIGRMTYAALIPCLMASLIGDWATSAWGVHHTAYPTLLLDALGITRLDPLLLLKVAVAAAVFGLVSTVFAESTHGLTRLFRRLAPVPWLRPALGGVIVLGLMVLVGSRDYLGLGVITADGQGVSIVNSFKEGAIAPWSWALKLLFTAVTLGSGFKGGEVTPLFFIGATLGHTMGVLLDAPIALFAAIGFVAVFAGATNTPLACTIMGVELFGAQIGVYLATACFLAYLFSGHSSIYSAQRLAVPKGSVRVTGMVVALLLCSTASLEAQQPPATRPSAARPSARLHLLVQHDGQPAAGALAVVLDVAPFVGGVVDDDGRLVLTMPAGPQRVVVRRIGLRTDTLSLVLRAGQDTSVTVSMVLVPPHANVVITTPIAGDETAASRTELGAVVVAATRGERRVEDTPLRVEVIDEEELEEKVAMSPGDIAMLLNETGGLRVQPTNPSLGGANVRVQGLRGRYTLLLADGLPLYGGQTGGLGLLQIPPLDLGRVEIIKGTASALYGSAALGGVINLVSRRPGDAPERTVLLNQTSRGGSDAVFFGSGALADAWGYTLLAGAHRQRRDDLDRDGWTDLPGHERFTVRPRVFFDNGQGRTAFFTGGLMTESRRGGTVSGGVVPGGAAWDESLGTTRADVGGLGRWLIGSGGVLGGSLVTARGSLMQQHHAHRFGPVPESDTHRTGFAELTVAVPRVYGDRAVTWLAGVAVQHDAYRAQDVTGVDYTFTVPAAFGQFDVDATSWLSLSSSARLDAHNVFGTLVNPRVSMLLRRNDGVFAGWTTRLSAGTGAFAPTPFTEETETTGLSPLALPATGGLAALRAERARSISIDVGGAMATGLGALEVNATAFGSRIADPLAVRTVPGTTPAGATRLALMNAVAPTRTWGGELLARLVRPLGATEHDTSPEHDDEDDEDDEHEREPPTLRVTASYTLLRSTECDPEATVSACTRREVPLTPRHALGIVASIEQHERSRLGVELYYTGRQALADNPFRAVSRPYLIVGVLAERVVGTRVGPARLFVNFENLTNVRQTRFDPLRLPAQGPGGRWTTDAWTELVGFTINGGVRFAFGGER